MALCARTTKLPSRKPDTAGASLTIADGHPHVFWRRKTLVRDSAYDDVTLGYTLSHVEERHLAPVRVSVVPESNEFPQGES